MNGIIQDLRYALRQLRKSPGFTVVAVLSLALGIGANTAIFSVVEAVVLRPLPYSNPERLVSLYEDRTRDGFPRKEFTPANYADCKMQKQIFQDVAAADEHSFNLSSTGGEPEKVIGRQVTWNLFPMLGVSPIAGRVFRPEEDRPGSQHEVLLSFRLWRDRFASDQTLLGRDVVLNGERYTVIGIMPPGFAFPDKAVDLWTPRAFTPQELTSRAEHYLFVLGRLQPGVSLSQANAGLQTVARRLVAQYPEIMKFVDGFVAEPLQQIYTRDASRGLMVLLTAVALTLLIVCANVANLLLSRAAVRQHEMSLRSALGATRERIVRQLLTESCLLAAAGAVFGVFLAILSFRLLRILIPPDLSRSVSLTLDVPVLGFTMLIALASTFLFGLAPSLQISQPNVSDSLKERGRAVSGGRNKRLGNLFVVGEIALSLVLLVASGLLVKSLIRLRHVNPGFESDHVLTLEVPVDPRGNLDFIQRSQFFQRVLERVRALPGVKSAGFMSVLPLTWKSGMADFIPEGVTPQPGINLAALDRVVSPGYFETLRIPLLRGRYFDEHDGPDTLPVAIINQTMARKFWPDGNALGKRIAFDRESAWMQVVGIVGDVKQMGLSVAPKEEMYFPYWQANGNYMMPLALAIRTDGSTASLVNAVRHAIWSINPDQPIANVMTMDEILDSEVEQQRNQSKLLGGLAGLAMILACIGIYGVMAYLVAQQRNEFGIRMALGARRRDILSLVLGRGLKLTVGGIIVGIAAGFLIGKLMNGLLFGVQPFDPMIFAAVTFLLAATALVACYFPAWRAAHVDPNVALRYE